MNKRMLERLQKLRSKYMDEICFLANCFPEDIKHNIRFLNRFQFEKGKVVALRNVVRDLDKEISLLTNE
jgi:hypothetical protein